MNSASPECCLTCLQRWLRCSTALHPAGRQSPELPQRKFSWQRRPSRRLQLSPIHHRILRQILSLIPKQSSVPGRFRFLNRILTDFQPQRHKPYFPVRTLPYHRGWHPLPQLPSKACAFFFDSRLSSYFFLLHRLHSLPIAADSCHAVRSFMPLYLHDCFAAMRTGFPK